MKSFKKFFIVPIFILISLQSCYSVIISNKRGVPEPDDSNTDVGFYNGKKVFVIDTTIKIGAVKNTVVFREGCPEGAFHSVEYRATLGGVLLSGITLGKLRKVKVKYTCLKEQN